MVMTMGKLPLRRNRAIAQRVVTAGAALCLCTPSHASLESPQPGIVITALPSEAGLLKPASGKIGEYAPFHLAQASSAEFAVKDASGEPGKPIPLVINAPLTQAANYSFVMIRGLPENFQVSAGFKTKNSWVVSLRDLKNLTITTPQNFDGEAALEIVLIRGREVEPESRKITVTARLPKAPPQVTGLPQANSRKSPDAAPATAALAPRQAAPDVSGAEETALLASGANALKQGNFSAARIMFEEIAQRGSAKGAFALAQTYDPASLPAGAISGIKPDLAKAQFWYEKAKDLGSSDAERRLAQMRAGR